ncbi:MAG TPA: hypothetical protein VFS68_10330 [Candidatus Udaeobacter sp.]|nr:hypothetical protein [Candidatus Udaeobacter sp.]
MALRRMASRFKGRCKRCGTTFSVGTEIYWSKPTGASCIDCAGNGTKTEEKKPERKPRSEGKSAPKRTKPSSNQALPGTVQSGRDSFQTLEWRELREIVAEALETGKVTSMKRQHNRDEILKHSTQSGSWHGFDAGQLKRWIREGYDSDAIRGLGEFNPPLREKPVYQYVEDGEEIIVDRALCGDDEYMAEWTPKENIPGVAIEAEIMFASSVSAEVVNAYNVFICRSLLTLEAEGIDCQVTLKFSSDEAAEGTGKFLHSIVRVKKENEATDFRAFSAMISPAALRCFGFAALVAHADSLDTDADWALGRGNRRSTEWRIDWNPDRRVLEFQCPYIPRDRKFPEDHMQRELREALHAMKTN